ncbi:amino acid adenylation domain-containing protein [Nostoc sp. UHCC 0251]|uniref:amino acid adenylation domain-containing protein n=1 Tax=Nostoc sp. UHCC 0251 TaxID=3110240 RepID=UPI002B1EFEDB|nr:amino acid adenylation domain-containing protein [Nostoc sp. UHCC 0251]MEA5627145.1 amino acid adenylation domain-containing protein [Nostoc sp. UHCC 0251]
MNKQNKNIESIYPLSPMQQGMLYHTLYAPESGVYVEQLSCTLTGKLKIAEFEQAWQQVVERHPVLRTLFVWEHGKQPLQVVCKSVDLPWITHDWQDFSAIEQQERLQTLLETECKTGFALDKAPLMRCTLIKLQEDTYTFIWSHHHLLMDGWCLSIILKEVFAFYEAGIQGNKLQLDLPRPYKDYILWQQQQDASVAELFWREKLQGFNAPTPLLTDKNSHQNQSQHHQNLQLSLSLTANLKSLAVANHLTLNTILQGAWALMLSRYSGEQDVVFGTTVSGRPTALSGVESMVGLFINTLPVRVQISGESELLLWLKQLQLQQVEQEEYSYTPLVDIQGWSEVPREMPLFESLIVFENYPLDASLKAQNGSIEVSNVCNFEQTNYPLTLVAEPGEKLSVRISYDTSRFADDTIKRMLGHLQVLLEVITENPGQKLDNLPLLTPAERHQLLVEWNNTKTEYPQDRCLHELFESQVEKTPDAVAVVFRKQQLTYRELNNRANQLAYHLQTLGVAPEVLVGICVNRSLEMMVGLLGILKAGGAYIPLDPTYPPERLAYMLADSQLPILLTQKQLLEKLPEHQAQIICLDEDWQNFANYPHNNLNSKVKSDNLAYIIYTSGSTGKPKGTMIIHSGMVNYLSWCTKTYNVADGEGSTVNSSIGFDATITSLFSPLLVGRKVVLLPEEDEIEELRKALCSGTKFSLVKITPAHLEILSHLLANEQVNIQTQAFIIGGEALSEKVTSFWRQKVPSTKLINEYGPTETVVGCCIYEVEKESYPGGNIPIGRPIANTELYILDRHLQPVPIGVVGELYIGGAGVARGYLNRPELTSERFIDNPLNQSKLYKTGDLARYLLDGNIEYVGRIDHQVKIRGFRIELGEIEALIAQHPNVASTTVIAREDKPGDKKLVAYIVPEKSQVFSSNKLHQFLQEKVPHYLIPSAFVQLDILPLTPNGKVDRKALPAPNNSEIYASHDFVAPRNEIELQLTQIWEDILNLRPIGVKDNFFNLGGHSLLVVRLMAQIQQHFDINLPLATILQNPTIAQIADTLQQQTDTLSNSALVAINQNGSNRPFFCVPGVGGNGLYFYNLARYLGSEQPFYTFQAQGLDGKSTPYTKIEDMATHYIKAMQTVQPQGPYILGGYSFGSNIAFEMTQQLQNQGHEVALLAVIDNFAPIDRNKPKDFYLDEKTRLKHIVRVMERLSGKNVKVDYEAWQKLNSEEQLNYLQEQFSETTTDQLRGLIQVFDANVQAGINYLAKDIYTHHITLFQTSGDDAEDTFIPSDAAWGWHEFASKPVEIYTVPGNHHTMLSEPHVQVLAQKLKACINQIQLVGVA